MFKTTVIECRDLYKSYEIDGKKLEVIRGVNLEVKSGEYVIIFGPSGCGKTTFLNLIAGLEPPDSGEILIRGRKLRHHEDDELARYHRRKIGIIFQNYNLIPTLSVWENIALPQLAAGISLESRRERAFELLEMFGLAKLANDIPTELSGGEQQRVALCRAMVNNPWIFLADEPTGNLDKKNAEIVMNIIYDLNRHSHRTVILVTHNENHLHFAHRVIYMKNGQFVREERRRPEKSPPRRAKDIPDEALEKLKQEAEI